MGNLTTLFNDPLAAKFIQGGSVESSLELLGSRTNPYFGRIQMYRSRRTGDQRPVVFSKIMHANAHEDALQRQHKERCKIVHPNILQYIGCQYDYLSLPGKLQETKLFFEYFPLNLKAVVAHHQAHVAYLEEAEIWKFAMQVISACAFLQSIEKHHGDLNLLSIQVDHEKNAKILGEQYNGAFPDLLSSYAKQMAYKDQNVFLSPQAIFDYAQNRTRPTYNVYKQDSFSLGMTLLELMNMEASSDCYNYDQKVIKYQFIMDRLGKARQRYSMQLIQLVQRMLTFEEQQRPNMSELLYSQDLNRVAQVRAPPRYFPPPRIARQLSPQVERTQAAIPILRYLSPQPQKQPQLFRASTKSGGQADATPLARRSSIEPSQRLSSGAPVGYFSSTPRPTQPMFLTNLQFTPQKVQQVRAVASTAMKHTSNRRLRGTS